jgi:hypothetical protein
MTDTTISIIRESGKYVELLAAIIGTVYFYKYRNTSLKFFLFILWYITFTEFIGSYASKNNVFVFFDENGIDYNHWMYNILYFVFFNLVLIIYLKSIKNNKHKFWIKIFIISYILISIINWSFIQSFIFEMSELPFVIGSIFLIISIIFYLIQLLKSSNTKTFHKELLFWISIGLLLFHTGTIPFSLEYNGYAFMPGIHKLFLIIYILSPLMYLIFTFGFIWSDKETDID